MIIAHQVPPLLIRLLGGFGAERDGVPVPERWRRPGAKTLVKLLAIAPGHRLHREQVMEVCRPGAAQAAAMSSLRVALHTARHALQPELRPREESAYLLLDGQMLMLSPTLVTVDADQAEALAQGALAESAAGEGRAARLGRALDALRPELLPEDPYAEWLLARRAELSLLRDRVLYALTDTHLAEGRPEEAAALLEWFLSRNPAAESAHERMLRALLALHRPEHALRHYQLACQALDTALGARPGALLKELRASAAATANRRTKAMARRPLPAAIRSAPPTPLFGRDQGLRVLTAQEAGLPALTLVAGEAGVGKTRLTAEAARAVHGRGATVLWGASHEAEGQTPYGLWAEALYSWLADQSPEEQAAVAAEYPALAALVPTLGPAPAVDVGPEEERARLFHAVGGLLDNLAGASAHGLLIVLDDLHAADLGSLQLLYHLVRRAGQGRRFIATFREEGLNVDPVRRRVLDAALRQGMARRLELMRLSERECGRLVAYLCGDLVPSPERISDVFQLSAGNPLFASELAGLVNSGLPAPSAAGLGSLGLPAAIRVAVDARLDGLDNAARALIDVLAAAGGDVPMIEASEVAQSGLHPPLDAPEFAATADRVLAAGLVEEREVVASGRSVLGYAFRHPLVRLACYERLTAARRRVLHGAYGDAVFRHRPDAVDTLVFHFVQADDPRAVPWLRRAAERASALYANDSADRYYAELVLRLDATGGDDTVAADVRHDHGLLLRRLARYPEAERTLRTALDCRRRMGATDAAVRSRAALAEVLGRSGRPRDARVLLDETLPMEGVSAGALALHHLASSVIDFSLGRYEQSLAAAGRAEEAAQGVEIGPGGDSVPLLLGRATGNRALALAMLDQPDRAEELSLVSSRYAEEAGDVGLLTTVLSMLSNLALTAGRHEEAREFCLRSLGLAERGGDPTHIAFERGNLAKVDLVTGHLDAAHENAIAAVDLVRPFGVSWCLAYSLARLAEVLVRRGEWHAAEATLRECAELAGRSGDAQVLEAVHNISAELATARPATAEGGDIEAQPSDVGGVRDGGW